MSTGDITKLPKWAQQMITSAEERAAYAENRLRESLGEGDRHSDTQVYMGYGKESVGLPMGTRIDFHAGSGIISVQIVRGEMEISTSWGGLCIAPVVTNVAKVGVLPR